MRYKLQFSAFLVLSSCTIFGQGRLILNNNAFMVVDNSAKVVIANPATNAVSTTGTGGNIVTESEFDQVIWKNWNFYRNLCHAVHFTDNVYQNSVYCQYFCCGNRCRSHSFLDLSGANMG